MAVQPHRQPVDQPGTRSAPGTGASHRSESTRPRHRREERRPLLTVEDVADGCGLSMKAVYRAIERRELRAAKLCSRLRIRPEDLDAWIERNTLDRSTIPLAAETYPVRFAATNGLRAMLEAHPRSSS